MYVVIEENVRIRFVFGVVIKNLYDFLGVSKMVFFREIKVVYRLVVCWLYFDVVLEE